MLRFDWITFPPMPLDPEAGLSRNARRLRHAFDQDHRLTKQQIGEMLGVVPRQAIRIVNELVEAGVPVVEGRQGRAKEFWVPAEHQRRHVEIDSLDEEALRALLVAAEASRALLSNTPLHGPLTRAFDTLLEAYDGVDYLHFDHRGVADRWHFATAAAPGLGTVEVVRALQGALATRQTVEVDYTNGRGERSTRQLDPLAFAPFPSGWQLAAWCHRRRAVRDFNTARIARVAPVAETYFTDPEDWNADAHFGGRFGALDGDGRTREVCLHVTRAVIQHFRTRPYHPSQRIEPDGDGYVVSFQVPETKTIRAWVRSWGPRVTALAPPELVRQLADDARATAARYA